MSMTAMQIKALLDADNARLLKLAVECDAPLARKQAFLDAIRIAENEKLHDETGEPGDRQTKGQL